ncbi:hypothetical protein LUW75_00605 [Streptomyces sp. MRC013]|uniref:hypothetical protein n=1 Tax=Streptomyces sp. MRC013 TaxID=2898276 RepID=UPI0020275829|nr:hypothetical protein [Streptomyces sp. MRC013]URM88766.1 hypothetical protein LUW75_00605 [Streptomyces sp. MRC013]
MKTGNALARTLAALALAACAVGTAQAADGGTPEADPGGWFRDCNIVEDVDRPNREATDEYVDCSRHVGGAEEETGSVQAPTAGKEAFLPRHHEYR